jgi:hypothetical protein
VYRRARAWPFGHALAVFWAASGLLVCPAAGAGSGPGRIDARLGFDGIVKIGVPVPLDVALPPFDRSGPAELSADAPALGPEVGRVVTSTVVPFRAVAGAAQVIHASVVVSDPRRPLVIHVSIGGREVARQAVSISAEQVAGRLLVAVSDDHAGLAPLHRLPGRVEAVYVTAAALPRLWQEYAAVDLLVIRDLDPALLDAAQENALRTWVHLGGRLMIIARRTPALSMLDGLLPATAGAARSLRSVGSLGVGNGAGLPPVPLTVTALAPRPGARRITDGDVAVMAAWATGLGQVTMWGVDPWQPPFLEWGGRLRWWDEAIGVETAPIVDPAGVAEKLAVGTPLDPLVHAEVGGAIVLYVALLMGLLRWRPTLAGAAASLAIAAIGMGGFTLLAGTTRDRSATVTQITILEPIGPGRLARATTIAAVAVPYGGRYRVTVPQGMVAQPITPSSNLMIRLSQSGTELSGVLRSGEPPRPFEAVGAVPIQISASLSRDGRELAADLGGLRALHVELRERDHVYPVGELPAGHSVTDIRPDRWVAASDGGRGTSELSQHLREAIFQGPGGGAILNDTPRVLVGELEPTAPVFSLGGAATPGQRLTILLVPLERR